MKHSAIIFHKPPYIRTHRELQIGNKGGRASRQIELKKVSPQHKNLRISRKLQQDRHRLRHVIDAGTEILCRAKAVFPFDLFPDEIAVESNQVHIIQRDFFVSETVLSIQIKNIADVYVETSPFFASLKLIDQAFKSDPITLRYLRKEDALRVRRVIQEILVASSNQMNTTTIERGIILHPTRIVGPTSDYYSYQ